MLFGYTSVETYLMISTGVSGKCTEFSLRDLLQAWIVLSSVAMGKLQLKLNFLLYFKVKKHIKSKSLIQGSSDRYY